MIYRLLFSLFMVTLCSIFAICQAINLPNGKHFWFDLALYSVDIFSIVLWSVLIKNYISDILAMNRLKRLYKQNRP